MIVGTGKRCLILPIRLFTKPKAPKKDIIPLQLSDYLIACIGMN
jgi:hypothetical protein